MSYRKICDVRFENGLQVSVVSDIVCGGFELRLKDEEGKEYEYHNMDEHGECSIIRTLDPWHIPSILLRIMMLPKRF